METRPLFRPEVLQQKINTQYGVVSLNLPPKFGKAAWLMFGFAVSLGLFISCVSTVEKYSVKGYLSSAPGTVGIYAHKNGIISERMVEQGAKVNKGDVLFIIDTDYQAPSKVKDQEISNNFVDRKHELTQQLGIKTQHLQALSKLLAQGYISKSAYIKSQEEIADLKNRLHSLDLEIINHTRDKSYAIRSPIDGTVASVLLNKGQAVKSNKPLAQIVPLDSELIAELYIPVEKSGFLIAGQKALIKYDAYPYERFGSYAANISEIAQTILTDDDEDKPFKIGHPYYRAKAQLQQPNVYVYGHEKQLQHGMTLTAVIIGPKRKIWQWILDPVFSFYGSTFI